MWTSNRQIQQTASYHLGMTTFTQRLSSDSVSAHLSGDDREEQSCEAPGDSGCVSRGHCGSEAGVKEMLRGLAGCISSPPRHCGGQGEDRLGARLRPHPARRHTHGQTDRQTDRQTDTHTHTLTHARTHARTHTHTRLVAV